MHKCTQINKFCTRINDNVQKNKFFWLLVLVPIAAVSGKNRTNMLIVYYKIEYIAVVFPQNRINILNYFNIKCCAAKTATICHLITATISFYFTSESNCSLGEMKLLDSNSSPPLSDDGAPLCDHVKKSVPQIHRERRQRSKS